MKFLSVRIIIILVLAYILLGAVAFHFIENRKWIDSFYFATSTISTVGFGDVTPQTDPGKIFTIFYILLGVSITAYAFSVIGSYMLRIHLESTAQNKEKKEDEQTKLTQSEVKK